MTLPPNLPYSEWTTLQSFYQSTGGQHWQYKNVIIVIVDTTNLVVLLNENNCYSINYLY